MFPLALLLLSAAPVRAADCVTSYGLSDLEKALTSAEAAYAARNRDSVHANVSLALDRLRCLSEEMNTATAARVHRGVGLDKVVMGNDPEAVSAFAAARAIEPSYDYTSAMAPEGSALRSDYSAGRDVVPGPATALEVPATLKVRIDGMAAVERPARPAVIQAFDLTGHVLLSGWYAQGAPLELPAPEAAAVASTPPLPTTGLATRPHGPNRPLLYGAIGAIVAGGALYGSAWATHGQYQTADEADKPGIVTTNHVLTISAFSAAGLGLAGGVLAVATGSW